MDDYKTRSFQGADGDEYRLIDSDTLENIKTGESTRLLGFDGLETSTLVKNDDGSYTHKHGELGGDLNTQIVADVIEAGGFNRVVDSGKDDVYNRNLGSLKNAQGEDLTETLFSEGLAKLDSFTTERNTTLKREGEIYRRLFGDTQSLYAEQREALRRQEDQDGLFFKGLAIDESEYDPAFHSDVQFRDPDRTLTNKPKGLLSGMGFSYGVGWDGIKEGFWGYIDAIGQTTGVEMVENIGEQGVMRARSQLADSPELLLNYDQVEGLYSGFQYVLNNAAMSAPYMVTTFGAMAASVPVVAMTGGGALLGTSLATLPTSVIYAGQTWNEMEGEKGVAQFVASSVSGVGQATLELLGLKGLIAPAKVFSNAGQQRVINALVNKRGLTKAQAQSVFTNAVGKSEKQFLTGLMRIKPEDIANFSIRELGPAALKGAIRESLTEVGQESLQMGTAAAFSDKEYTQEEVLNRLANAAVAGGTLGGTLGAAGNTYQQSRNRMRKAIYSKADQERLSVFELFKVGRAQAGQKINTIEENLEAQENKDLNSDPTMPAFEVNDVSVDEKIEELSNTVDTNLNDTKKAARDQNPSYKKVVDQAIRIFEKEGGVSNTVKQQKQKQLSEEEYTVFEETVASLEARQTENQKTQEQIAFLRNKKNQGINSYTVASEIDKTGSLAQDYIQNRKGMINVLRNAKSATDIVEAMAIGTGKLFRGAERAAIKAVRAVANPVALDILSRVGGALGDVVHSGMNFKEYQDSIIRKAKMLVDDPVIAKLYGYKSMRYDRAVAISKRLIQFGKSGGYLVYRFYRMQQATANLNLIVANYLEQQALIQSGTLTPEQRLDAEAARDMYLQRLNEIGFTTANEIIFSEEIKVYQMITRNSKYAIEGVIQRESLYEFLEKKHKNKNGSKEFGQAAEASLERDFLVADSVRRSYDYLFDVTNDRYGKENPGGNLEYNINLWWNYQGFDYREVRKDPVGFKRILMKELGYTQEAADRIYDNIAKRGETTVNGVDVGLTSNSEMPKYSLLDPTNPGYPLAFTNKGEELSNVAALDRFRNKNLFETLNKTQVDSARYTANAKYFGQGGWKLHQLFRQLEQEGDLTREELTQFAFFIRSMINSANGNFNRIESPRLAALNSFATSWSILAGLPLSAPSSIPEFGMVYFDIKDDEMFKQAAEQMVNQISTSFTKALDSQANKGRALVKQVGLEVNQNTIADRLATGERDVAFARIHEAFFKGTFIQGITQLQRRVVSVVALDAIRHSFDILEMAPTKRKVIGGNKISDNVEDTAKDVEESLYDFDFENFSEIEQEAYRQLTSLGFNIERMMSLMQDVDSATRNALLDITDGLPSNVTKELIDEADPGGPERIKPRTQREAAMIELLKASNDPAMYEGRNRISIDQAYQDYVKQIDEYITEEMTLGIQRYVHERIQMPGHSNRPLVFQDPHYQLITQFNGFISTFTANIIPKLYARGLKRGNIKVKADTFALIVMLLMLGGASQYLKDLIKFQEPSPYLDTSGYIQRAFYASGVLGQYERVVDIAHPLYPQRDEGLEWLSNTLFGEAGPTMRNVGSVLDAGGLFIEGEGERGFNKLFSTAPFIGPATNIRRGAAKGATFQDPFEEVELPNENEIKSYFLGSY
jgi:hypothetical protein